MREVVLGSAGTWPDQIVSIVDRGGRIILKVWPPNRGEPAEYEFSPKELRLIAQCVNNCLDWRTTDK